MAIMQGLHSVSSTLKQELKVEVSHTNTPNLSSWSNHGWFYVSVRIGLFLWVNAFALILDYYNSKFFCHFFGVCFLNKVLASLFLRLLCLILLLYLQLGLELLM